MLVYNSDAFNEGNEGLWLWSLRASAICTEQAWVPCLSCNRDEWDYFPSSRHRFAVVDPGNNSNPSNETLKFIKINRCDIQGWMGWINLVSVVFMCGCLLWIEWAIRRRQDFLDKGAWTTTDFSLAVTNPPADARDPDEWKEFFESNFGKVASMTVTLNNEPLIAALRKRRLLTNQLANLQPPGVEVDTANLDVALGQARTVPSWEKILLGTQDAQYLSQQIKLIDEDIQNDLSKRTYLVSEVFVIFERMETQQKALKELTVGGIHTLFNNTSVVPPNLLFRGEHLLSVEEPPEPSSVRWKDLDESLLTRLRLRFVGVALVFVLIVVACVAVLYVRFKAGPYYAALVISMFNSGFPYICKPITSMEAHPSEAGKEASNFSKITFCQWVVTTILTALVTPFVETLENQSDSLIRSMNAIFISNMCVSPALLLSDVTSQVYRHILAPRALDQRRMNAYFTGTRYALSERYTVSQKNSYLNYWSPKRNV